jgi:hypothetical protein
MATNVKTIAEMLKSSDMQFELDEAQQLIWTGFGTDFFRNPKGEAVIWIMIHTLEDGRFVVLRASHCFRGNAANLPVLAQACAELTRRVKSVRFEIDPQQATVSLTVHIPLEDAVLTQAQLMSSLFAIPAIADRFHEMISTAAEHGELVEPQDPYALRQEFEEFLRAKRAAQPKAVPVGLDE